jgi:hypothetical protein
VASRRSADPARLVADSSGTGEAYVLALRQGDAGACDVPEWMLASSVADLAVHLEDLHERWTCAPNPERR